MIYNTLGPVTSTKTPAGTIVLPCFSYPYGTWESSEGPSNGQVGYNTELPSASDHTWKDDPSRGRSFKKLKESGEIAMSAYSVGKRARKYFVSEMQIEQVRHSTWYARGCSPYVFKLHGPFEQKKVWTERTDFQLLSALRFSVMGDRLEDIEEQISAAVSGTQQKAYVDALNGYDLLTEMGELRETVSYLLGKLEGSANLMRKLRDKDPVAYARGRHSSAKSLSKSSDKALRALGSRWMEYRYAIMPLLYSFKDISKVLNERGNKYHSSRARETILLTPSHIPENPTEFLWRQVSGTIEVRSLTKASYDIGALQNLANAIGLNPFRTAWELIPLSFVVDWFLNIGDAIATSTTLDYASSRNGCTSVKRAINEQIYHKVTRDTSYAAEYVSNMSERGVRSYSISSSDWTRTFKNLVYEESLESYDRFLFNRPEPRILFDPFLNWKRTIDGFVLSYQPIRKLLRSLK